MHHFTRYGRRPIPKLFGSGQGEGQQTVYEWAFVLVSTHVHVHLNLVSLQQRTEHVV